MSGEHVKSLKDAITTLTDKVDNLLSTELGSREAKEKAVKKQEQAVSVSEAKELLVRIAKSTIRKCSNIGLLL